MRGLGVAVVMNDHVHAPRYVTKSHMTVTDTMISPGVGPISTVDDSLVWLRWRRRGCRGCRWSSRSSVLPDAPVGENGYSRERLLKRRRKFKVRF